MISILWLGKLLTKLSKVTESVNDRAKIRIQVDWLQSLSSNHYSKWPLYLTQVSARQLFNFNQIPVLLSSFNSHNNIPWCRLLL